ncbi:MAG: CPBP family intramembrane glutamic endopeptidase [candidate division WOR-3 bacterium]
MEDVFILIFAPLILTFTRYMGISFDYINNLMAKSYFLKEILIYLPDFLFPFLLILIFKTKFSDYGFRLPELKSFIFYFFILYLLMLPLLIYASERPDFKKYYPEYKKALLSLRIFTIYEIINFFTYLSTEVFFRGVLVIGLSRFFGIKSILISNFPYVLVHFGKPVPEIYGSFIAGLVLGYIAYKDKSIFTPTLLHFSCAFTLDLIRFLEVNKI